MTGNKVEICGVNTATLKVLSESDKMRLLREMHARVLPDNETTYPIGAITIDNEGYGRYMGELQIIRMPQPADPRTNVAAMVDESECNLLQYITPGRKFSFRFAPETDII